MLNIIPIISSEIYSRFYIPLYHDRIFFTPFCMQIGYVAKLGNYGVTFLVIIVVISGMQLKIG